LIKKKQKTSECRKPVGRDTVPLSAVITVADCKYVVRTELNGLIANGIRFFVSLEALKFSHVL
jgi:hypothetical protein